MPNSLFLSMLEDIPRHVKAFMDKQQTRIIIILTDQCGHSY